LLIHGVACGAERLKVLALIDVPVEAARDPILHGLLDVHANVRRFTWSMLGAWNAVRHVRELGL
jgi:hypothetical protein